MYDGALADLRARFGGDRVLVVDFETTPEADALAGQPLPGAQLMRVEGNRAWFRVAQANGSRSMAELMPVLFRDFRVRDVSVEEPEIEEVVRQIYEGKLLSGRLATDDERSDFLISDSCPLIARSARAFLPACPK